MDDLEQHEGEFLNLFEFLCELILLEQNKVVLFIKKMVLQGIRSRIYILKSLNWIMANRDTKHHKQTKNQTHQSCYCFRIKWQEGKSVLQYYQEMTVLCCLALLST